MTDLIERDTVTDGGVAEAPNANLALSEIADRCLWSVQPDRQRSLDSFMQAVFVSATRPGEVLAKDSLRLLQLWPHKAWLLASNTGLPGALDDFSDIMTDIGHGFCEFRLAGEQALDFLGSYTSANPAQLSNGAGRSLRCLLGQYPVVLWWEDNADIRLLVERSRAQSFYDYIANLMARWSPQSR
jgi:sarcosine oxidase gamma subunit